MKKKVVLHLDSIEPRAHIVETEFSEEDIQKVAEKIFEELTLTDDGWNEDKLITELEKKGYIKIIEDMEIFSVIAG